MQKLMSEVMGTPEGGECMCLKPLGSPLSHFTSHTPAQEGGDLMQGMMESILSKELLYPSLLDISKKYPQFLEEKRLSIAPADHERYTKQFACIREIVAIYETTMDPKKQTQLVMEKMEKVCDFLRVCDSLFEGSTHAPPNTQMQDLGTPPAELVEDGASVAFPKLPTGEQCSVM